MADRDELDRGGLRTQAPEADEPRALRRRSLCPEWRERSVVPIAYGLPGEFMWEACEAGEIVLGGCVFEEPSSACTSAACDWRG